MFGNAFRGKTVLVTGHTGFKGSWLALWLIKLGAKVVGYSAYLPSDPCNFEACKLEKDMEHITADVRDIEKLKSAFARHKPEIVFHLAAQPIVRKSYAEPKLTFDTNLGGTVNVLECIRTSPCVKAGVMITSDKCYRNNEWVWGYRENDTLGGDDPYGASKACAELAIHAYVKSFFPKGQNSPRICSTRAGNVIGGGDWAADRIIPDCVRAWADGKEPAIRNPEATRPWQHVLEPLSGYLCLCSELLSSERLHGEPFNFGPDPDVNEPVSRLVAEFQSQSGKPGWKIEKNPAGLKEATLLRLSCDKAYALLGWRPALSFADAVRMTARWYAAYYKNSGGIRAFSLSQIDEYSSMAGAKGAGWASQKAD